MEYAEIARRYAKAMFDLALERGKLDAVAADWDGIGRTVASSPVLVHFFKNPVVSPAKKRAVVKDLFEGRVDAETFRFLMFLSSKNRLMILASLSRVFSRMVMEHRGIEEAVVITAAVMDAKLGAELGAALTAKFSKRFNLEFRHDPSLIGGFQVLVGDHLVDLSLWAQLREVHCALYGNRI